MDNDIAIIGMAGRFPGARDVATFWTNLRDGVESILPRSAEELRAAGVPEALLADPHYVRAAAALDGVDRFDAAFFGMTPRQAALTDPQQRLFLECAWEAMEDAGLAVGSLDGRVGVIGGASLNLYIARNLRDVPRFANAAEDFQVLLGNEKDYLATQTAYRLRLTGLALSVQTACSTSLVAVHLACQGLLNHECDVMLAGGVTLRLPTIAGYLYQPDSILSPDGHCRPFSAEARGTVMGSGAGVVVLKRLTDALADGDPIDAVIKGSAVTNDGAAKAGFAAPGVDGQAAAVAEALAVAGVAPDTVGYVEAHGTGTALGDPIEVAALNRAFAGVAPGTLRIGSVKGNIGHLEAAAGIAGLIKTVLALKHGLLPPSLHCAEPNPLVPFAAGPFRVNTALGPWPATAAPRRAGVSSFGIGGTNAHVVLEEAPRRPPTGTARRWQTLVLSARSAAALARQAARLHEHLGGAADISAAAVAATAALGRVAFEHRLAVVGDSVAGLRDGLLRNGTAAAREDGTAPTFHRMEGQAGAGRPRIAFLFAGQGGHHAGMGAGLASSEPVFRRAVERCDALLRAWGHPGVTFLNLFPNRAPDGEAAETDRAQTDLFALQYGLVALWRSWGVEPDGVLGHSVGEVMAAVTAGCLPMESALRLVMERGRLMRTRAAPGAMAAVAALGEEVEPMVRAIGGGLCVAALNAPAATVIAGPEDAVRRALAGFAASGVEATLLPVNRAFHSAMMDPAQEAFAAVAARVSAAPPDRLFVSTLDGRPFGPDRVPNADYWSRQMREPVRFANAVAALAGEGCTIFVEIGPRATLGGLARQCLGPGPAQIPSLRPGDEDGRVLACAVGRLFTLGIAVGWRGYLDGRPAERVHLPPYPFERSNHWIEPGRVPAVAGGNAAAPPVRGDLLYGVAWRPLRDPRPVEGVTGRWRVLGDAEGFASALCAALRAHGVPVVEDGEAAEATVDLRALDGPCGDPVAAAAAHLERAAALLRALEGQGPGKHALWLATRGAQPAGCAAPASLDGAALWGFGRAAAAEHPGLWGGLLDLDPDATASRMAADADLIARHLLDPDAERQAALRAGRLLGPRLLPETLPPPGPSLLRLDGAILITGGFGHLGMAVAQRLAQAGARHLVLLGRTPLPERSAWAGLSPDSEAGRRAEAVRALETMGVSVQAVSADVGAPEALEQALGRYEAELRPPIRGIVHAAGLYAQAPAAEPGDVDAMLRAKVGGALALHRRFAGRPLDFFVLFSSTSALIDSPRLGSYSAGNAMLDSLAARRRADGECAVSIAWGPWATGPAGAVVSSAGTVLLDPEEATAVLERLLTPAVPAYVAVMDVDWDLFSRSHPRYAAAPLFNELSGFPVAAPGGAPRLPTIAELSGLTSEEQRSRLLAALSAAVAGRLGTAPADLSEDRPLNALGLDSLTVIELRNDMAAALGVTVPMQFFFSGAGLGALADLLLERTAAPPPAPVAASSAVSMAVNDSPQALLARLDTLSEAEIDALLARMGGGEGTVS